MIITLPLPPRALSPNARGHWAKKMKAVKKYREDAALAALAAGAKTWEPLTSAKVECRFFFRPRKQGGGRMPDPDNLIASMKAGFDGLTDAGVFADDNKLVHLPPLRAWDAEPRVEIHVSAL